MEIAVVVLLVLNLVVVGIIFARSKNSTHDSSSSLLQQNLNHLSDNVSKLQEQLQNKIDDKLDKSQASMTQQLAASSKIVQDVSERLTKLDETNKRVVDVADELKTLQNVLQNPKQRGVVGEYYLQTVLENVLPPGRFELQYKFKDGEIVDAVIFLEKEKVLPIDSKFSLENYNRYIEAKDKTEREKIAKQFKVDLKNRIDETAKYIRERENTMDFAFMFIPSESLYYDLLTNRVGTSSRDLIEYAFSQRRVIIVSPTSFMAYLQTVLQGLRSLQIEEQAKEIQKRVGDLGRHIGQYEVFMQKLGNSLGTTVNHYNTAHKELKKVDKDIIKIADTKQTVEPIEVDKPTSP
jgi:DNA recombination protein RmuC